MKKVRNVKKLSLELGMERVDVFTHILDLNSKFGLNIDNYDDLEDWQCTLIKATLSKEYVVRLLRKDKGFEGAYCYRTNPQYATVATYIADKNLNGKGTKDVMELVSDAAHETVRGKQMVAFAMREAGYESKVSYIGDKQRRLWFKEGQLSEDRESLVNGFRDWVKWNQIEGRSLSDILMMSGKTITPHALGSILREIGYETRVTILDNGRQARRWYKNRSIEPRVCDVTTKLVHLDLNGLRIEEIKEHAGDIKSQHLGRVLKELGYECKITRKDGVQARRWYKKAVYNEVSFL